MLFVLFMPDIMPGLTEAVLGIKKGTEAELVMIALASGWMGAAFSMLISLRNRLESGKLDELRFAYKYSSIFLRVFIGAGAGLIFFYLVQSNIISRKFLPKFQENMVGTNESLALLFIWCFLSGFSEKLVPNILSKTETRVKSKT